MKKECKIKLWMGNKMLSYDMSSMKKLIFGRQDINFLFHMLDERDSGKG